MKITKGQQKEIGKCHLGYGWIVFKSGEKTLTEIEIYIGKDNTVRRVLTGKTLEPIYLEETAKEI